MQAHEHAMATAVASHENNLSALYSAANGDASNIPTDWPVEVTDGSGPTDVTCGYCKRSWDDAIPTSMTPAPSARCPFEAFHGDTPAGDLESLGVDAQDVEESARDALNSYALEASTSTVLTVTLAIGGPTQYLSATVERDQHGGWERTNSVTFFDSWAVPNETVLADDSPLVTFFDNEHVELMAEGE